jgi:excisionase family DNA binding protein
MYADDFAVVFTSCLDMIRKRAPTAPAEARAMMECYEYLLRGCLEIQLKQITVNEAAKLAGKSPSQIRRMIAKGKLTAYRGEGERLRIVAAEVPLAREHRLKLISVLRDFVTRQQP